MEPPRSGNLPKLYGQIAGRASYVDRVEGLMREGCDDSLIGVGKPGRIALNFTREARSRKGAAQKLAQDAPA
jgi:hypothetical protein